MTEPKKLLRIIAKLKKVNNDGAVDYTRQTTTFDATATGGPKTGAA
jgi:hypothetical protein